MSKCSLKTFLLPLVLLILFIGLGLWRWSATGKIFYLYNFGYIGLSLFAGLLLMMFLQKKNKVWGRRVTQLLVGLYMLVFLGFIGKENMQIEGFFNYLLAGVFAGATLHYFAAKIAGPFIFGRGWCGWACWTAALLDFLPWSIPKQGRIKNAGIIRYIHFAFSLIIVLVMWFVLDMKMKGEQWGQEFYWLAAGNALYYAAGISLAAILKDNRAFCKYLCPIPVLQKIGARVSVLKIKIDSTKCIECGLCQKLCPMDIKLLDYKREGKRVLSTECIICGNCMNNCPRGSVQMTFGFDGGIKEHLNYSHNEVIKINKLDCES